jgi:predicted PurR-regulated permease PerM
MQRAIQLLLIITLGVLILDYGSALFVPLAYAVFISFLLYPFSTWMETKGLGRGAAVSLAVLAGVIGILIFLGAMTVAFSAFAAEWPLIKEKLGELITQISVQLSGFVGLTSDEFNQKVQEIFNSKTGDIFQAGQNMLISLSAAVVLMVLIPVYVYLILFYRHKLVEAFLLLMQPERRVPVREVLGLSIKTYFNFIKGMLIVYLIVGGLNTIGLLLLGIPHPFFFGFLTAVMTFIPYLGILLAGALPVVYAWMTYGTIWQPLGVVAVFAVVQYLEANVIFPWAVGRRLEMNTLATLVVIVTGGIIWGASGMILFVPFAAILKLIADRMEGKEWRAVSGFLGT